MDGGAWQAAVKWVAKSQTQLKQLTHTHICVCVYVYIYITESLCYTPEGNTMLSIILQ